MIVKRVAVIAFEMDSVSVSNPGGLAVDFCGVS